MLNLFLFVFSTTVAHAQCQSQIRGLFDVGSGSTKLTLAKVNVCPGKVRIEEILEERLSFAVALEASKNSKGEISAKAQAQAVQAVKDLRLKAFEIARKKASYISVVNFAAVGTHAFRTATNKKVLADQIEALGIPMKEVSQADEGRFGYEGVKVKGIAKTCGRRTLWVWDIGGGSWQLTSLNLATYDFFGAEFGAEAFKSSMIRSWGDLKPKSPSCPSTEPSPNPIGRKNVSRAIELARLEAQKSLGRFHLNSKTDCLVGIGGVHVHAAAAALEKHWPQIKTCACRGAPTCAVKKGMYSRQQLHCLAEHLSQKSDCDPELKGDYSTTAVSNLFLILGFLEQLKIDQIPTLGVNMGHHLLQSHGLVEFKATPVPSVEN